MSQAIELEIFRHIFASVAEEMGERLMRAAYSPNVKERRDFSCALFDAGAEMIAQAAHIPVHLGSTPMSVEAVIQTIGLSAMRPGDRYLVNDPYQGGTHLPDLTLVAPCFLEGEARPRFFVANRAHHADVGGIAPGSLPLGRHIDDEGYRIGPTLLDEGSAAAFCAASRTPEERRGDLMAQQAAAALGVARLQALCARHGAARVSQRAAELQDYADRMTRARLAQLPDGEYAFEDFLDGDGLGLVDIPLRCVLRLRGGLLEVDLTGCAPQVVGPLNAVRAISLSAVAYVLRCLGDEDLPSNGGAMRSVRVLTQPGTVADARYPAPVAAGNVETSQRLVDVILGAFARALPGVIPAASCGSMNNVLVGGVDPRTGQPFAYYETLAGGAGAGPRGPGESAIHTHMTNTLNTPVEALEHAYPMRIERYRIRDGSGGAGLHAGGDGLERAYRFLAPAHVTLLGERRARGPWGLQGGAPGAPGEDHLNGQRLPAKVSLHVAAGDVVSVATPGGGGWGEAP